MTHMPLSKDLQDQISDLLGRLATLSEAPASNFEPRTSHGKSSSRAPTGVSSSVAPTDPDRRPPEDRSLYDWFVWELERIHPEDTGKLVKLVGVGRMKYEQRAVHTPRRTLLRAGTLDNPDMPRERKDAGVAWPAPEPLVGRAYEDDSERPNQAQETEDAAARRVVEWYEGVDALAVAVNENTTEVWVRKARKSLNRDPDHGRKRAPFRDWDDAERQRQIDLLRARAKSEGKEIGAKTIANHFGVDKNTVKKYLDRPVVAA
jgi:hypothetical protein